MVQAEAVFVNLFPIVFYSFLLAAVTVVNKAEIPPLTDSGRRKLPPYLTGLKDPKWV